MPRLRSLVIIMVCGLLPASEASAQRLFRTQGPPLRQACFGDYMKFCRGVPMGGGRILNCLNTHADELSQTCFQALALRGLAYAGALKICRPDYDRLCAQVPPGFGRGLQCMLDNLPSVSPTCRDALSREGFLDDNRDAVP